MITTDADGRITFINEAAVSLTGFPRKDSEGHPFTDIIRMELAPGQPPLHYDAGDLRPDNGNRAAELRGVTDHAHG